MLVLVLGLGLGLGLGLVLGLGLGLDGDHLWSTPGSRVSRADPSSPAKYIRNAACSTNVGSRSGRRGLRGGSGPRDRTRPRGGKRPRTTRGHAVADES